MLVYVCVSVLTEGLRHRAATAEFPEQLRQQRHGSRNVTYVAASLQPRGRPTDPTTVPVKGDCGSERRAGRHEWGARSSLHLARTHGRRGLSPTSPSASLAHTVRQLVERAAGGDRRGLTSRSPGVATARIYRVANHRQTLTLIPKYIYLVYIYFVSIL